MEAKRYETLLWFLISKTKHLVPWERPTLVSTSDTLPWISKMTFSISRADSVRQIACSYFSHITTKPSSAICPVSIFVSRSRQGWKMGWDGRPSHLHSDVFNYCAPKSDLPFFRWSGNSGKVTRRTWYSFVRFEVIASGQAPWHPSSQQSPHRSFFVKKNNVRRTRFPYIEKAKKNTPNNEDLKGFLTKIYSETKKRYSLRFSYVLLLGN